MTEVALAVDVGATKIAAGRVTSSGELLGRRQIATAGSLSAEELFGSITALLDQVRRGDEVVCGAGCAGPIDVLGRVSPLNIPAWREFPLGERLGATTGLPSFVNGDAKSLTLAEGWVGTARGESSFLAMVVSTGIGGGIVLNGRLLDGVEGNAGHIGHLIVEPEGRVCVCGATGCLEAEASGLAIEALTGRPPKDAPNDIRRRTGLLVGRACASVANLLDLGLCVVSGSVALGYGEIFFEAAQLELSARARLSFSKDARVVPSILGADGPLIGAAAVGWTGLGRSVLG